MEIIISMEATFNKIIMNPNSIDKSRALYLVKTLVRKILILKLIVQIHLHSHIQVWDKDH
jgi:hypothetical protein